MMLYIQECSIDLKNDLPIKDFEIFYELKDDNKTIGFSAFRKSNKNPIYIFIKKDYRGNGYGKFLFSQMFEKLKVLDFDEFIFTFEKSNIPILRILEYFSAMHVNTKKNNCTYMIPKDYVI